MLTIKIQSISDIITNSSSESFIIFDEKSINSFKENIQLLFDTLGYNVKVDEAFDIHADVYDEDRIYDYIKESYSKEEAEKASVNKELFIKYAREYDEYSGEPPVINDLVVEPKAPKYKALANIIGKFVEPFDHEAIYC